MESDGVRAGLGRRATRAIGVVAVAASALAVWGAVPVGAGPGAPVVPVTIVNTVVGTDPGVAFPITLTCSSEGEFDDDSASVTDITIPNDDSITEPFSLRNGESATSQVTLPPSEPFSAECSVTEALESVELPEGYSCTVSIAPPTAQLYPDPPDSVTFAVTNACAVEVAEINFTG